MNKLLLSAVSLFYLFAINPAQSTDNVQQQKYWREKIRKAAKTTCIYSPFLTAFIYAGKARFKYSAIQLHLQQGKTETEVEHIIQSQDGTLPQIALTCSLVIFAFNLYLQFEKDIDNFLWNKLPSIA